MSRPLILVVGLFFVFAANPALAQVLDGVVSGGGPSSNTASDVAMDADGNHFIVGTFNGTATFGAHSITAADDDPGNSWSDAFLVKYDADGEALWARRGGTGIFNTWGHNVATGPDGSVYWSGLTTAHSTFDGGDNPDGELTAVSVWEAFIAKYDTDGNIQWVQGLLGSGNNSGRGMAVAADGTVYFVGSVEGTASIGDVTISSFGGTDGFVVQIDPEGTAVWGTVLGGSQSNSAYAVDIHPDGGVVVSGQFRGVATFGEIPLQSAGLTDTFAARIDAEGEVIWASNIGAQGDEFNRGMAVASDGSVYLTGSFEQEMLIGSDILVSPGFSTVYVVKLNVDGNPVWGRRVGGTGFDFGEAVAVDADDNVYATGYVDGSFVVSTGNGDQNHQTAGDNDGYLVAYSPDGDLLSLDLIGGSNRDRGQGVAVSDAVGRLAVAGWFRASFSIGDDTVTSAGGNDAFLAFGSTHAGPAVSTEDDGFNLGLTLSVFPNPTAGSGTVLLTTNAPGAVLVELFDVLGRRAAVVHDGGLPAGVHTLHLGTTALAPGTYIIRAQVGSETVSGLLTRQ